MLKLEKIRKNAAIVGIEPNLVIRIVTTEAVGSDALTVYCETEEGLLRERMLFRSDETNLALAKAGRPWAFDAQDEAFIVASDAYRIKLANVFDPVMTVHTSDVQPLPHQITAVSESMLLPLQPLRYLLADGLGSGKTIMACLPIREMLMHAQRILIVAPNSLVEHWQDEMAEMLDLDFTLLIVEQSRENAFEEAELMVDQLTRSAEPSENPNPSHLHLVVVDEAIKLSANYFDQEINKIRRFQLDKLLSCITRQFLLMFVHGEQSDSQDHVRKPFTRKLGWAATSVNLDLDQISTRYHNIGGAQ